jgi:hypothetical protein
MTYTASNSVTGTSSKDTITLKINALAAPSASLLVSTSTGQTTHSITANVGDTVTYTWYSLNATIFNSSYLLVSGGTNCPKGGESIINNFNGGGSSQATVIPAALAGCTYRVSYVAKNITSGATATDSVTVAINNPNPVTASLAGASPISFDDKHNFSVNVGLPITYNWSSTGGDKFSSSYTGVGAGCTSGASVMNSASGTFTATVPAAQAGCVYTVNYVVTQSSTGATAQDTVVETVNKQ